MAISLMGVEGGQVILKLYFPTNTLGTKINGKILFSFTPPPPHPLQSRLFLMKIKYGGKLFYEWNLFIEHLLKFKISTFTLCFSKKDIWEKSKVNYISILMKPSSAINID